MSPETTLESCVIEWTGEEGEDGRGPRWVSRQSSSNSADVTYSTGL